MDCSLREGKSVKFPAGWNGREHEKQTMQAGDFAEGRGEASRQRRRRAASCGDGKTPHS